MLDFHRSRCRMNVLRDRSVNTHLRPHTFNSQKSHLVRCEVPYRLNAASHPPRQLSRPKTRSPRPTLPIVVISPPPGAVKQLEMSPDPPFAAPITHARESPDASPSSIPLPHGLKPTTGYPVRRDSSPSSMTAVTHPVRRHSNNALPRLRYPSTGSPSSAGDPTPYNFSRPRTSHSHSRALTADDLTVYEPRGTTAPKLRTAAVGKSEKPRIVHNKPSNPGSVTPASSLASAASKEKSSQFSTLTKGEEGVESSPQFSQANLSEEVATPVEIKTLTPTGRAHGTDSCSNSASLSISEELIPKFNRHLYLPPPPVRFASSLPSIPSQKSLGFTNARVNRSQDSDSDGSSFSLQISGLRSPRYTLTRSPSPLNSSSSSEPDRGTVAVMEKSKKKARVPSIGYPSNPTGRARQGSAIEPPEVPRLRRSMSPLSQTVARGAFSLPTASTTAKKISFPGHEQSRSSKVMNKLSGIFSSTRRSSAPVSIPPRPVAKSVGLPSRPESRPDVNSVKGSSPHESHDVHDLVLRDLARVKTLVRMLKIEADKEGDTTRELSLRQAAQILQESMICAVEARISATKADEEAEKARLNCEMAAKAVERLTRI